MSTVIPHPPFCASNVILGVTFTFTFTISLLSVYTIHVGQNSVHNSVSTVCGLLRELYVVITISFRNLGLVFERVAAWQRLCSVRNMSDLVKLACTVFVRDKEVNRLNTEETYSQNK